MTTNDSHFTELPNEFGYEAWTIRYCDVRPAVAASGQKLEPVVFTHGTPWSSCVFVPLAKSLFATNRYRIILFDLPGYGVSQKFNLDGGEPDTSVGFQGQALAALLKHLGVNGQGNNPKPHMIAHDIAGVISLRANLIENCDYRSLCLLDTNTVLPWGDKFYNLVRDHPTVFEQLPHGIFAGALKAVIQSACHNVDKLKSGWEKKLAEPWLGLEDTEGKDREARQKSFVRQIKQSNDRHTAEMLESNMYAKIQCDVKIIWGQDDQWIPREKMDRLAKLIGPRVKDFVVIPEAGHLVMVDAPERLAIEVGRWLEK